VNERIDLRQRAGTDVAGKQGSGAARLLEKEPRFVDFGRGDDAAVFHADAVLLRGQLRRGRQAPHYRGLILRLAGLLGLAVEEGSPKKKDCTADENHFHPV